MIRKTVLMAGIAGAMLMAVPALAQDAMSPAPQTPPSSQTAPTPSSSPATPAAPSGALQLQPGADVKGSDGSVLGKLEGVRNNDAGEQELTVRGSDGQLRGVPLGGLRQEGAGVVVAWTTAEFTAAPAIAGATPSAAPTTPPASPAARPAPTDPSAPPTTPSTTSDDEDDDTATPPPTEPQS